MSEDILVRAKRVEYPDSALRILPELIAEVERLRNLPRADVAAYDRRIQEMAAKIKELEAEVEAKNKQIKELQDLIDKPPEDADWVADYHLLQSALDGPIIDAARKWHAAYRKAQNSNLMRAKEVERLRSQLEESQIKYGVDIASTDLHWQDEIADKDARNKELEEMIRQLGSLAFMGDMPLDQIVAHFIAWGQSNYDYTSRLEVAFLRSNAAMRYYQEGNRGPWPQLGEKFKEPYQEKAREELERIRNGE